MSLIDCVIDESNIYRAIHTLKSNKGSKTPGVNGEIISDILKIEKLHFVVDIDIKGFFDNVNHKKLIKQLQRFKSIDKKTLSLIKKYAESGNSTTK